MDQASFHLYDHDWEKSEHLGMCSFHLTNAQVTDSYDTPLRDPQWIPFFKEVKPYVCMFVCMYVCMYVYTQIFFH